MPQVTQLIGLAWHGNASSHPQPLGLQDKYRTNVTTPNDAEAWNQLPATWKLRIGMDRPHVGRLRSSSLRTTRWPARTDPLRNSCGGHHQVDQCSNEITQIRKGRYTKKNKKMYPVLWATKKLGTSKFRMWLANGISWTHRSTLGIDFGTHFSSTPTPKLHC